MVFLFIIKCNIYSQFQMIHQNNQDVNIHYLIKPLFYYIKTNHRKLYMVIFHLT